MIITIKNIIDIFKEFAGKHPELNDFGWGMTYDIGTSFNMKMPYMWVTHRAPNRILVAGKSQQTKLFNFSIILADKINTQKNILSTNGFLSDNSGDILNKMDLIAHDLIAYIQHSLSQAHISEDVAVELVYDETDDKVAGWLLDVTIKAVYKNCINPIND